MELTNAPAAKEQTFTLPSANGLPGQVAFTEIKHGWSTPHFAGPVAKMQTLPLMLVMCAG